jgi:peptide-methionine (R)-S-oxide reductase
MTAREIARAVPIDLSVIIDTCPRCGCLDFPVKLLHKQLTAGYCPMVKSRPGRAACGAFDTGPERRDFRSPRGWYHWNGGAVTAFDMTGPTAEQRRQITAGLSDEERHVLLQHGTEAAFCGVFLDNKKEGIYTCRFCGLPLFRSSAKFDSGTGWPSFFKPYEESHIKRLRDTTYGMVRVEEVCARCGSHLGHVFPDGPRPTGERHCLNSVSLGFTEKGGALPDVLGRGAPEGVPDPE